jgi:hypothetical protein
MARPKGDGLGRLGGRKKGTPNKENAPFRRLMEDFCHENYADFCATYKKILNPKERAEMYMKAMAFVAPKPLAVDFNATGDVVLGFKSELDKMAEEEK